MVSAFNARPVRLRRKNALRRKEPVFSQTCSSPSACSNSLTAPPARTSQPRNPCVDGPQARACAGCRETLRSSSGAFARGKLSRAGRPSRSLRSTRGRRSGRAPCRRDSSRWGLDWAEARKHRKKTVDAWRMPKNVRLRLGCCLATFLFSRFFRVGHLTLPTVYISLLLRF